MVDENTSIVKQGSLAGGFIPMKEEMTHDILAQYYGITGNLRRFETEKDDTFQVTTNDNNKYVLKIANPDEDFDEIDFQHGILKHVEYRDPSLPVPPKYVDANKLPPSALNRLTNKSDPFGNETPIPDGEKPLPPLKFC